MLHLHICTRTRWCQAEVVHANQEFHGHLVLPAQIAASEGRIQEVVLIVAQEIIYS